VAILQYTSLSTNGIPRLHPARRHREARSLGTIRSNRFQASGRTLFYASPLGRPRILQATHQHSSHCSSPHSNCTYPAPSRSGRDSEAAVRRHLETSHPPLPPRRAHRDPGCCRKYGCVEGLTTRFATQLIVTLDHWSKLGHDRVMASTEQGEDGETYTLGAVRRVWVTDEAIEALEVAVAEEVYI
jgi:hypothetical protein